MTIQTMSYVLARWGVILGALLGQFAGAVIQAYHGAFTRDALRVAFLFGMIASLAFNIWLAVAVGTSFIVFVMDFILGTLLGGMAITAGRLVWNIISDAVKSAWNLTKVWFGSLWAELKWRLTGEVDYVRPDVHIHKTG